LRDSGLESALRRFVGTRENRNQPGRPLESRAAPILPKFKITICAEIIRKPPPVMNARGMKQLREGMGKWGD